MRTPRPVFLLRGILLPPVAEACSHHRSSTRSGEIAMIQPPVAGPFSPFLFPGSWRACPGCPTPHHAECHGCGESASADPA